MRTVQDSSCPRSVTEEPFKIPYYAALLRLLHDKGEEDVAEGDGPTLGRQILEDFWKGVQAYMDKQAWKETRSCVRRPRLPLPITDL